MIGFNFYHNYRQPYTVIPITTVRGPLVSDDADFRIHLYFNATVFVAAFSSFLQGSHGYNIQLFGFL